MAAAAMDALYERWTIPAAQSRFAVPYRIREPNRTLLRCSPIARIEPNNVCLIETNVSVASKE
jgi:hypothetical protein